MANRLVENPFVIDTAAATVLWTGQLKISQFVFTGYAVDTDEVIVTDAAGNVVWQTTGNVDLSAVSSDHGVGWVAGLIVPTLTAGAKLLVYYE